ncbi:WD40-repeat-containing domain protein [Sporodiniella umbellata]|nr:WD40-repeat-containing domain protein [Sporodiniella umbellata]
MRMLNLPATLIFTLFVFSLEMSKQRHGQLESLYVGFNQDQGCFAVGLDTGFRVYNCDPLTEHSRNESEEGGVGLVEMLYRTNYLALVGGGRNPRYAPNKVVVYDSKNAKPVFELEYKSQVKNVKLRKDKLTVLLCNKVYVYHFSIPPQLLETLDTCDNEKGLAAISTLPSQAILAIPGKQKGYLQIVDLHTLDPTDTRHDTPIGMSPIHAHSGHLSALTLSGDGTRCATSSDKGTLIRVFDTLTGTLLHELRRGMDRAEIYTITFNPDATRLCTASDKGTLHLFNLDPSVLVEPKARGPVYGQIPVVEPKTTGLTLSGNRASSLSFMKHVLPKYFSSEWSFAHAKILTESKCVVSFGSKHSLMAICADGSCYRFGFDPTKGGECTRESFERFLK